MAISKSELNIENEALKVNIGRIDKEIKIQEKHDKELSDKIAYLKKDAKGKYSEELETTNKLFDITHKNLTNYRENRSHPYFARIDFREFTREKETYYIGKFGIGESSTGDELVIDWRAPVADLYYSGLQGKASYEAPIGWIDGELYLKRKFVLKDAAISDAFDEGVNELILRGENSEENTLVDEFLKINLEESVSSKLKEVVATIQKEQNDIIRANMNGPLIIQGSAGSGKTTVALHRLAYLLYKHRKVVSGSDILVIAPNKLFLDYISGVLPSLGVGEVKQKTFEDIAKEELKFKRKLISKDTKLSELLEVKDEKLKHLIEGSSKIKGSLFFKKILDRYLRYIEIQDEKNITDIKAEDFVLFSEKEVKRLYLKDLSNLPLDKRKDEIKRYFKVKKKDKLKEICEKLEFYYELSISRVRKNEEDSEERRKKLTALYDERDTKKQKVIKEFDSILENYFKEWKHENNEQLYLELFQNEEIYKEVAENSIPCEYYSYILSKLKSDIESNNIDSEDLIPMLYLKFKINGINETKKFKHIVIDEAQDYSLLTFEVIKLLSKNNSFTIVGDIGQGIYYYKGIDNWHELIEKVLNVNTTFISLKQSYRSTVEIIEVANLSLEKQKLDFEVSKPVLRHGEKPKLIKFKDDKNLAEEIEEIADYIESNDKNTIAIICKNITQCNNVQKVLKKYGKRQWKFIKESNKEYEMKYVILPTFMTKGLEFDATIIFDCSEENYKETIEDSRLLYVALSRALHYQYLLYQNKISKLISQYTE